MFSKCWSHVTIEPALIISFVVSTITSLGSSNLMLQKLCYKNGTGPVLGVICPTEVSVQKEVALVQSYKISLDIFCKVLIIIISSSWKSGSRKPYFVLPICGHIMVDVMNITATYFWQSSVWVLATGTGILAGISGIGSLMTMGATLYASDNTTPEQRTLRIGIYESIYACSAPIGSILSGYLVLSFGFYTIFLMSIIGNTIAIVLLLVMIKENPVHPDKVETDSDEPACKTLRETYKGSQASDKIDSVLQHNVNSDDLYPRIVEITPVDRRTKRQNRKLYEESNLAYDATSDHFDRNGPNYAYIGDSNNGRPIEPDTRTNSTNNVSVNTKKILEANYEVNITRGSLTDSLNPFKICLHNFRILLKPRGSHRTTVALIMIFITMLLDSSLIGEFSLLYYYVRRKFGWNERDYGTYGAFKAWIATFGVLFALGVLGRLFKLKDTTIGLLACASNFFESLAYMFVSTNFLMYMVPLIDMFHVSAFVVALSILSKEIDVMELPNVLAVNSIVSTIFPLLTTPVYMMIYRQTVDVWPAAFFVLGAALAVPAFIAFLIVNCLHSRRRSPPPVEKG